MGKHHGTNEKMLAEMFIERRSDFEGGFEDDHRKCMTLELHGKHSPLACLFRTFKCVLSP